MKSEAAASETYDASHVDLEAFHADLRALRRELEASLGQEDLDHLRMVERVGRAATALGALTAFVPNPVSMFGLGLGRSTRWILMHHIGHRGYDKVPNIPAKYTSKVFARGARRFVDWADWMIPEAWIYEHNVLHHSYTGEERDPDLIERNAEFWRNAKLPMALKYVGLGVLGATWRFSYYAPNTLRTWLDRHLTKDETSDVRTQNGHEKELWLQCYLPYGLMHFAVFPALYLPLGPLAALSALINSMGAEAIANLHTFCVVGPNHTGDDLYRFDTRPASKAEGMLRQVLGSVNYETGTELIDLPRLYLNYQIEHHLFPDLPMLAYRRAAPKVKALCEKHGIPYVQEGIVTRVKKMLSVAAGKTSMKRVSRILTRREEIRAAE